MDYKKILEGVVDIINTTEKSDIGFAKICTYIGENCPELKESNDERIRKEIIDFFKDAKQGLELQERDNNQWQIEQFKIFIDWLERQGENANFQDKIQGDNQVTRNYDNVPANLSQLKQAAEYVDEVKPQFHKGDWIVHHGTENIYQVVAIIDNQYQLKYGDNYTIQNCADVDRCARLWDVTKDAKDGDVLVMQKTRGTYESIFIFNKIENNRIIQYLHYFITDTDEEVCEARSIDGFLGFVGTNVHPATKEQRDILFQKMHEAGYEWDAEKKELKKISQEYSLTSDECIKPTWSEEDRDYFDAIITKLEVTKDDALLTDNQMEFLKSLKDRYTWKPSEGEMEALKFYLDNNIDKKGVFGSKVAKLYDELKKLREE